MAWPKTRPFAVPLLMAFVAAILVAPATGARAESSIAPGGAGIGATTVRSAAWISTEAERLSGRRLTVVCAVNARAWAQELADVGLFGEAEEFYGFSLIRQGEMHLSPYVCEGLRLGTSASSRRANEFQVAWSVNVLVHESVHMARFTLDEKLTEACARIGLPIELHRLYRVAYHSAQMSRLTSAATWFRRTQPSAYQGGTCPPPA